MSGKVDGPVYMRLRGAVSDPLDCLSPAVCTPLSDEEAQRLAEILWLGIRRQMKSEQRVDADALKRTSHEE